MTRMPKIAIAVTLLTLVGAPTAVATQTSASPKSGIEQSPKTGSSDSTPQEICSFTQLSDDPHLSNTQIDTINTHGYWKWDKGTSTSCKTKYPKAKVTVYLQSSIDNKKWVTRNTGEKDVRAGGGSGRISVAPYACKNFLLTKWRSQVDVDVIGLADTPGKTTREYVNVKCGF